MSFYGEVFIFDGVPSDNYGLYLYDFQNNAQSEGTLGTTVDINESRVWGKYSPIHYNVSENTPMEFDLICSVGHGERRLDRFDLAEISGWLKKPGYRYLQILQPDLEQFRYKCIVSMIDLITVGLECVGIKAHIVCDGPYAYFMPETFEYVCNGTSKIIFQNKSNVNGYYYPSMEITTSGGNITIQNLSDGGRQLIFKGIPAGAKTIVMDGINGIVSANDGTNMYEYFNFNFFRCIRGDNSVSLSGNFALKILTEFPADIGC